MKLIDRKGEKYGRLLVVERAPNKSERDTNARWLCQCECGKTCVVYGQDLKKGRQVSCGCWNKDRITTHGMSRTHINSVWRGMWDRCTNPKARSFKNYGASPTAQPLLNGSPIIDTNVGPATQYTTSAIVSVAVVKASVKAMPRIRTRPTH